MNNINKFLKKYNYKLIEWSNDYKDKLTLQCGNGHIFQIRYSNLCNGRGCSVCSGKYKMSFDEIKKYVSDNNHILLSTEYNNNKEKLNFICNNGHEYQTSFSQFKSGKRCSTCSKRKKYTLNDITSFIEKEGL